MAWLTSIEAELARPYAKISATELPGKNEASSGRLAT